MEKTLYSKDYQTLLALLREVRENANVTQIKIANTLGTTQTIVSKCERGERRLDVLELRQWCLALGIPFHLFLAEFDYRVARASKEASQTEAMRSNP